MWTGLAQLADEDHVLLRRAPTVLVVYHLLMQSHSCFVYYVMALFCPDMLAGVLV
jgi:hypothetical protein